MLFNDDHEATRGSAVSSAQGFLRIAEQRARGWPVDAPKL